MFSIYTRFIFIIIFFLSDCLFIPRGDLITAIDFCPQRRLAAKQHRGGNARRAADMTAAAFIFKS